MSAATVVAVAAVASAGVAAYSASQSAGEGGADQYGSKVEPVPYDDKVGTNDSYARHIYDDTGAFVDQGLPQIFDIATQVQQRNNKRREKYTGGNFRETVRQEGANVLAMERGQVPQDVIDSVNRIVAENLGGAVDPIGTNAGFGQSGTANTASRNLGLTSMDMMKQGMAFGPSWRSNADSFIYKPQDAARDFFFPAAQMALEASKLQMQRDESEYVSNNNIARASAMPNPQTTGALNDQAVSGTQTAQGVGTLGSALAGLVTAYSSTGTPTSATGTDFSTGAAKSVNSLSASPYQAKY